MTNSESIEVIQTLYAQMYGYSRQKNYQAALDTGLKLYQILPNDTDLLSDLATYSIFLDDWVEAIKYALLCISMDPSYINAYDALAHAFGELRDWKQAGEYGRQALELRDARNRAQNPQLPSLPKRPDTRGKKNIISLSLFGGNPAYTETAILNAQLTKEFYPHWTCRFYVDDSVPQVVLSRLASYDAEVIKVTPDQQKLPATMWRFLALDDPKAGYVILRDADAVISRREASAVADWQASHKRFHTIRDASSHTELVMAGLWGAIAGSIPDFTQKMVDYCQEEELHPRFADQFFLRDRIWQYLKQDLYASDRIFGFYQAHPLTKAGENYEIAHIGCDEGGFGRIFTNLPYPDGTKVVWSLYSQISPLPNDDLSPRYIPERLVCQYESQVMDQSVQVYMPRRYGDGLTTGKTRVAFEEVKEDKPAKSNLVLSLILDRSAREILPTLERLVDQLDLTSWVISDVSGQAANKGLLQDFFTEAGLTGAYYKDSWPSILANPGKLLDRARAKGDYVLNLTGNDRLTGYISLPSHLSAPVYSLTYATHQQELYQKPLIFKADLDLSWVGGRQGYFLPDQELEVVDLTGDYKFHAASQAGKKKRTIDEAKDLEKQQERLKTPQQQAQNAFACALAHQQAARLDSAQDWFKKVLGLADTCPGEAYAAALKLAQIHAKQQEQAQVDDYLELAAVICPNRAEAWYQRAKSHNQFTDYHLAYAYALMAKKDETLTSSDFLTWPQVYAYQRDYELTKAALGIGEYQEAALAFERLVLSPKKEKAKEFYDQLDLLTPHVSQDLQAYL